MVGGVVLVQKIDDNDIELLPVAVAAADALLDALRIPGKVVVDDEVAELEVDALGGGLRGDHDRRLVAEVLDQGGPHVRRRRAGNAVRSFVLFEPAAVDVLGAGSLFVPLKSMTLPANSVCSRMRKRYSWVRRDSVKISGFLLECRASLLLLSFGGGGEAATQARSAAPRPWNSWRWIWPGAWNSRSLAISCRISVICSGVKLRLVVRSLVSVVWFPLVGQFVEFFQLSANSSGGASHGLGLLWRRSSSLKAKPLKRVGNGVGRRRQKLSQDERHEGTLAGRQGVKRRLLQVFGNKIVEPLLLRRRDEFLHQGMPVGVVDVFQHLLAERPLANRPEPLLQVVEVVVVCRAA